MIYAIQSASGAVKIGRASDPKARLAALQTANAETLSLIGTSDCESDEITESMLHDFCKPAHIRGEWFRQTERVKSAVAAIAKGEAEQFATRRHAALLLYTHRGSAEDLVTLCEIGYGTS